MPTPINLTEQTFEQEVLKSTIPVLVDFWAPWCGPCQMMAPVLEAVAAEIGDKVKITKLDVEVPAHTQLVMQYGVSGIPNLKVFYQGQVVKELVGYRPKEVLVQELRQVLQDIK